MTRFEITFKTHDAYLGELTCVFQATQDAVKLHRKTLALREADGEVYDVKVRPYCGGAA